MFLIRFLIFCLLLICIVGAVTLWFGRIPLTQFVLSKKLKTEVTVDDVSLAWGKVTLKDLRLKNPPSSKLPYAFEAGSLFVQFTPSELWKRRVHIQRIKIQDPHLTIELYNSSGNDNNWSSLLTQLPSSKEESTTTPSRTYVVDRLSLVNFQIDIIRSGGKKISLPSIPYLEFQGIGGNDSNLTDLLRQLFIKIIESVPSKQNLNSLLDKLNAPTEGKSSSLESVKETVKGSVEVLKQKATEAKEYLQNLFSK